MRNTLMIKPIATHYLVVIKSATSLLAYHCMIAMRVLTPYLFAANIVVMAPHARPVSMEEAFDQQNISSGHMVLSHGARSPSERARAGEWISDGDQ